MSATVSLVCLGIGFAVCLGFALVHYQDSHQRAAIWWGLGAWIFAGVGVATFALDKIGMDGNGSPQVTTVKELADRSAAQQRSFLKVDNFALAIGTDSTGVFFRLTADGPTYIDIESGEIGISIDDPPLSPVDRSKGLYTAKIKPQRITPRQQAVQSVQVARLPSVHQQRLLKGPPTEVFYVGEIHYWDAFKDTGTRRHKREFAYGVTDGRIRSLDMAIWARNNETDDP